MFILWAIPVGIVLGLLAGGRLGNLSTLRLRLAWLAVAGLLVQVVLFTPTGDAIAGNLGPGIYIGSTFAVLIAVLANLRLPGMPVVALGAVSNLAAIMANGGSMPASPEAIATAGLDQPGEHTNSVVLPDPALEPLTDIFAIPAGLPFANVFSVGDVLIAAGIVLLIAWSMRRPAMAAAASETTEEAAPA